MSMWKYANYSVAECKISHNKTDELDPIVYLYNVRLMSDYEVTLVNDNSMSAFSYFAKHMLTFMSSVQDHFHPSRRRDVYTLITGKNSTYDSRGPKKVRTAPADHPKTRS
jgi:hypothetical protein